MTVLTVNFEMAFWSARAQDKNKQYYCRVPFFLIFIQLCDSRKNHYLTREFHVKLHLISDIALIALDIGFRVQFKGTGSR